MTPRLDPALPLVWRSPRDLQLGGVRPVAVLPDPGPAELGVLRALAAGASESTLHTIGGALGASAAEVDALLERLEPAFAADASPHAGARVALGGDLEVVAELAPLLRRLGHQPVDATHGPSDDVEVAVRRGQDRVQAGGQVVGDVVGGHHHAQGRPGAAPPAEDHGPKLSSPPRTPRHP